MVSLSSILLIRASVPSVGRCAQSTMTEKPVVGATLIRCNFQPICTVNCRVYAARFIVPKQQTHPRQEKQSLYFDVRSLREPYSNRSAQCRGARKLLGMDWHQVEVIKTRAAERGLKRRKAVYKKPASRQFFRGAVCAMKNTRTT